MSRNCITVLTGHNHYVMCAQFHPDKDLVVSASLDQTVRVWDTSGLRKKTVRGVPSSSSSSTGGGLGGGIMGSRDRADSLSSRVNADFFGSNDAVIKYVLEGHERGVNWASFHPTMPLIVSGADDRMVKLWRMSETKAWEVDTMRGHGQNVSCVLFHPRAELVISNSEDRTIRVWDVSKTMGVQTFRRDHDRFWILAAHPTHNLLAAGHDAGMMVFKLERERPAYACNAGLLFYVKDRYLRRSVLGHGADVPLVGLRRPGGGRSVLGSAPRSLTLNPHNTKEYNLLLHYTADGGSYELFCMNSAASDSEPAKGRGVAAAVFLARNKFITLDSKLTELSVRTLGNAIKKRIPNLPGVNGLFTGDKVGRVLLRSDDKISLYEPQSRRVLAEVVAPRVKYVAWSKGAKLVALMSKNLITIAAADTLEVVCSVTESVRIKSGVWDDETGVFVYTTHTHIKYLLAHKSGEAGIVRSLDNVLYALECQGDSLQCLDREGKTRRIALDRAEYRFKQALVDGRYDIVLQIIESRALCGQAVVSYLQRQGYAEVALQFVEDPKTRFNLALEYGNLPAAREAAEVVNSDDCWHRLAVEGLRQGNHQMVTMAYQRTKDLERLSFLYLIIGNLKDLQQMLDIARMQNNVMGQYHNSLYLGDVEHRLGLLERAGQTALAYATAATHGLTEAADRYRATLQDAGLPVPALPPDAAYLAPPTPLIRGDNWPLLKVNKSLFTVAGEDAKRRAAAAASRAGGGGDDLDAFIDAGGDGDLDAGAWGMDDDPLMAGGGGALGGAGAGAGAGGGDDDGLGGVWGGDDLDLGELDKVAAPAATAGEGGVGATAAAAAWRAPAPGVNACAYWARNSSVPADHVAAGGFEKACQLLANQIGVSNFAPLKPYFEVVYSAAQLSLPLLPSASPLALPLARSWAPDAAPPGKDTLPAVAIGLPRLQAGLKRVFEAFQGGKFDVASKAVSEVLHMIPLCAVESKGEVKKVKEWLALAKDYKLALALELKRRATPNKTPEGMKRHLELAAYFTFCQLKPRHQMLALNLAMALSYKAQNFINAAGFATRLLELPEAMSAQGGKLATRVSVHKT